MLNHDLDEIADAYECFKNGLEHRDSEYIFSINRKDIKDHCNINPQHYSPKLNESLNKVLDFDNK